MGDASFYESSFLRLEPSPPPGAWTLPRVDGLVTDTRAPRKMFRAGGCAEPIIRWKWGSSRLPAGGRAFWRRSPPTARKMPATSGPHRFQAFLEGPEPFLSHEPRRARHGERDRDAASGGPRPPRPSPQARRLAPARRPRGARGRVGLRDRAARGPGGNRHRAARVAAGRRDPGPRRPPDPGVRRRSRRTFTTTCGFF